MNVPLVLASPPRLMSASPPVALLLISMTPLTVNVLSRTANSIEPFVAPPPCSANARLGSNASIPRELPPTLSMLRLRSPPLMLTLDSSASNEIEPAEAKPPISWEKPPNACETTLISDRTLKSLLKMLKFTKPVLPAPANEAPELEPSPPTARSSI